MCGRRYGEVLNGIWNKCWGIERGEGTVGECMG